MNRNLGTERIAGRAAGNQRGAASTVLGWLAWVCVVAAAADARAAEPVWDVMADTWVVTDGLGRVVPRHDQVGGLLKAREFKQRVVQPSGKNGVSFSL